MNKKKGCGCAAAFLFLSCFGVGALFYAVSRVRPVHSPRLGDVSVAAEAPPEGSTSLVLILDTSGSMVERVASGESKLTVAKTVLTEDFLPALADDLYVAAYRFEGNGGGLLAPLRKSTSVDKPGWQHREVVMELIEHVGAAGGTPIAGSLRTARGVLENVPGRKVCVLVTDGEESYETKDSVIAETRTLRERGVETYVVGFNLGDQGQYLANELGVGKNYFVANGGREALLEAMKSIEAAIEK